MAPRRGFQRQFSPRAKRQTAWGEGPNAEAQTFSTVSQQVWSNGVVLTNELKATIVRVRGYLSFVGTSFASTTDFMRGAMGIGIASTDAFVAGQASLPSPGGDTDWPWLWHSFFDIQSGSLAASSAECQRFNVTIDSKAMRKWGGNETLFAKFQVLEEGGTVSAILIADTRVLVKLS